MSGEAATGPAACDTAIRDPLAIPFEFQVRLAMADWLTRDPASYVGWDWWQLSREEEAVFGIDRARFPILACALYAYEAFKDIACVDEFGPPPVLADARQRFPAWAEPDSYGIEEFVPFAKRFCGVTAREAWAIWWKYHFWNVRIGVVNFLDES